MDDRQQLEQAIESQESLRGKVDDDIIDAVIATLRKQLEEITKTPDKQRKLVSILFTDIVQSTEMVLDLDPEVNMEIMDSALKRLAIPVEEHGGRVTRYMGDGFLAVFGAPIAKENDPEMAVRAGLGILETAKILAQELESEKGIHNFQVRVGINTGLVALGGMTEAEDTLMGSPVNLAKRVESAAPPGRLLISHNTYQHVRGILNLEIQESIKAKGFKEPVRVYQVIEAKQSALRMRTRGVEGIETRMVGRYEELLTLKNAYRDAVEGEKKQVITLIGEAGVGKSRLLYEFQNWLEFLSQDIFVLQGNARQETQNRPNALLRDMFAYRFQIQESDDALEVRNKMEAGFGEVLGENGSVEMRAHITGQFLGFDFSESQHLIGVLENPRQLRDRSFLYLKEYFEKGSERSPTVVFLEDIHWGDNSSLDILNRLLYELPEQRMLVVFLTRRRLLDRYPEWGKGLINHSWLTLEPLSQQNCNDLVDDILRLTQEIPVALRDLIVSKAGGNPYYVEELIKMLIDDGVILTGEERWWIHPEWLREVKIPATLTSVLQARLDSLPPDERKTLQQASVVGHTFWDRIVAHIQTASDRHPDIQQVVNALFDLQGREMIYRQSISVFVGAEEYIFKHAILRDVTYESVLLRLREEYHGLVADWLIEHAHDRVAEYAGLIADHLELGGRAGDAIGYLLMAGEQAAQSYANTEAVAYFSRAIKLAERDSPEINCLARLHRGRGLACEMLGDFDQARVDHEAILQIAQATSERRLEWLALLDLGKLWASRDYNRARDCFERALELARRMDDPAVFAGSLNWMGNWHANAENPLRAVEYHQQALEIVEEIGNRRDLANTLDLLGLAYLLGGDLTASIQHYDRAIALSRELNDRPRLVSGLIARAAVVSVQLQLASVNPIDPPDALRDFEEALRIAREIGSVGDETWAHWALGQVHTAQGRFGTALEIIQSGLLIASKIEHREYEVANRFALGLLYVELLATEHALRQLNRALTLATELRSQLWIHYINGALAGVYFFLNDLTRAKIRLETVLSAETPMDALGNRCCWTRRAELALYQDDPALALDIVERLIASAPGMSPGRVITFLWMLKSEALSAMEQQEQAYPLLIAAIENAQATGERFLLWRLHASLGRLYNGMGQGSEAEKEFTTTGEHIQELADTIPPGKLRDNFIQRAYERLRYSP
jgi:class 3 adenylate cyclase/tetratricopeptide (TPR) repeat protein